MEGKIYAVRPAKAILGRILAAATYKVDIFYVVFLEHLTGGNKYFFIHVHPSVCNCFRFRDKSIIHQPFYSKELQGCPSVRRVPLFPGMIWRGEYTTVS